MIQKDLPPEPVPSLDELPPPYLDNQHGPRSASYAVRGHHEISQPVAERGSVNKIALQTRQQNIVGTYYVDPDLHDGNSFLLPKSCKTRKRDRKMKNGPPNASFRTKRGTIDVNLAVTGRPDVVSKANLQLVSRSGDIAVNLVSLRASKHVNLDCYTRHGNIVVLLPRNYCGAIQLRTQKGEFKFLPALANIARIVNLQDKEALILMGDTGTLGTSGHPMAVADYTQLVTRKGRITIGLTGADIYVQQPGLWKRLNEFFMGKKA